MSGQIFISYRREESRWSARSLHDRLCRDFDPKQIFMDIDAIALGEDFVKAIETTVAKCDVLITVIGNNWLTSKDERGDRRLDDPEDFVRMEIGAALKREIRVIPVLVDGALMPRSDDLPEDLKPLVRRNALRITDTSFDGDCQRLASAIRLVLEKAAAEQREREEKERLQAEQREREEKERLQAEQRERENERLVNERREKDRLEAERLEAERRRRLEGLAQVREERERSQADHRQREEKERSEAERLQPEEKERLGAQADCRWQTEQLIGESREPKEKEQPFNDANVLFQWISKYHFLFPVCAVLGFIFAVRSANSESSFVIWVSSILSIPNFVGLVRHLVMRRWTIIETIAYWIGAMIYGGLLLFRTTEFWPQKSGPSIPIILAFGLQLLSALIATTCVARRRIKVDGEGC
jgi:hypothetical protein